MSSLLGKADTQFSLEDMRRLGFMCGRQLPDGRFIGVLGMFATWGLCVGVDDYGYCYRYCYEKRDDALLDLAQWDGTGDPQGPWIKKKGLGIDLLNPKWAKR